MLSCTEALLPVSCLKAASFRGFGRDITRSPLCPSSQTHTHIPYPHLMIIFFSCCKTGWLASQREQLPLALGVSWPLAMFTGRCAPRKRNQLPPSSGPISSHWTAWRPLQPGCKRESRTVWCGNGVVGSGNRWLTLFLYLCHCLDNIKAACKRRN